jgi:FMN phosphatase YigB (HAD superfamily)
MPAAAIDTVIFDVGGVLATTGRHSDFARRFPPEQAERVTRIFVGDYAQDGDHPWHRLERGEITLDENRRLNRLALAEAGIDLPVPAPGGAPMIEFTASEPMVTFVKELRAAGIRLGVLTNNVLEFRDRWRAMMPFDEWFDDLVDSHEVGVRKPNPAIYQLALASTGGRGPDRRHRHRAPPGRAERLSDRRRCCGRDAHHSADTCPQQRLARREQRCPSGDHIVDQEHAQLLTG